jgi:glycerol-3-phosphate acyltransferase PlsX
MKIVLDAMGGDHAPAEPVAGAVQAAREYGIEIILVGPEAGIKAELAKYDTASLNLPIINADEIISMHDEPVQSVREKKNSSIVVGMNLVKDGKADAFVSAGHSGAIFAAASLILKRIKGVERAGIGTVFPTKKELNLVIDVGANTEVRPDFLIQFAQMGAIYVEKVLKRPNPKIGLLSNGEEETKGTPLVKETHDLLKKTPGLNFIGNVEGKDVLEGVSDVVVTDGFTGNILLKTAEGTASVMLHMLKKELTANLFFKLLALGLKPAFNKVKKALDHEEFGGAPLLGINGIVVISHGRTKAKGIKNSIRVAKESLENNMLEALKSRFAQAVSAEAAETVGG